MFQVFEVDADGNRNVKSEKSCDCEGFPEIKSWKTSKFSTFDRAVQYAQLWLGPCYSFPSSYFKLNEIFWFDGCETCECGIVIREVK